MADHLLHLDRIDQEGYAVWSLTCTHPPVNAVSRWRCHADHPESEHTSTEEELLADGCWLYSWWAELGAEMIGDIPGPIVTPLAVEPSNDWDSDDGGTLVRDDT